MAGGFDFNKLCKTFSEICPDFNQSDQAATSQSLDFANKVLFDLGPKMRHIKQSGTAQMWRLIFSGNTSVFIYTYTFRSPINVNPHLQDKKLYLTLKQAGLLAASKLCSQLANFYDPRDKILLTPLARAVFLPQNIPKIAADLTTVLGRRVDSNEVVKAIICSCQTDGFHLQHSQCHVALVAIEVTVSVLAQRQKLREKTIRLYAKHGKSYNADLYKIYAQHSKLSSRPPDTQLPEPSTSEEESKGQSKIKSIDTVLRSIARTVDDPLTGGTLDMKFVSPPVSFSEIERSLPTPTDIRVEATNLESIRHRQTTTDH